MKYKLSEIVAKFGGHLVGADVDITGVASTDKAILYQITYVISDKYLNNLSNCTASAIILDQKSLAKLSSNIPHIVCENAALYFTQVVRLFHPEPKLIIGIESSVKLGDNITLGLDIAIANNVVIGSNSKIGKGVQIYSNVVIADNVIIGDNVIIYPNVTIYAKVLIGDNCVLHAGVVIGSPGFGNVQDHNKQWHKVPQIGGVLIGNGVNIGANTTIDCGTMEPTIIEDGVIIDNLVQIGHNVKIGAHTAIAANCGIAGSTTIGKYCQLGGASNITGHIEICDYSVIGGATTITKSIQTADLYFGAYPASTFKEFAKNVIRLKQINEMYQKIKSLETKLENLGRE